MGRPKKGCPTDKEFFVTACRWADVSRTDTALKWWEAYRETIVRMMRKNGTATLPELGVIRLKHYDERIQVQKDPSGKKVEYVVPERDVPYMEFADSFLDDVNIEPVSKLYRSRKKKNKLTQRDYLRELRNEALKKADVLSKDRQEEQDAEFREKMQQRKVPFQPAKKVDLTDDEE